MTLTVTIAMSEAEYHEHNNLYSGVCLSCGEIRIGDTEPDAEGYPCEHCEAPRVIGLEQALMLGYLEIVGGD